jgi:hypothetical protein
VDRQKPQTGEICPSNGRARDLLNTKTKRAKQQTATSNDNDGGKKKERKGGEEEEEV